MESNEQDFFNVKLNPPKTGTVLDSVIERAEDVMLKKLEIERSFEKSLIVVGNRSSGKTTLIIDAFALNDEEVKPTMALDFFCAFHMSDDGFCHKLCNIWELAGGTSYSPILMTLKAPINLGAVIMLDLSSPGTLWHTAVTSLDIFRTYAEQKKCKQNVESPDELNSEIVSGSVVSSDKFPLPLFVVGGKYDLFQVFEPEQKRVICQFLRYFTHVNNGFLFFYSNKSNNFSKTAKDVFNHHAFGTPLMSQTQFEYNQPLFIPPGSDSIDKIEGSPYSDTEPSMEKYKNVLNTYFKQDEQVDKMYPDNPRFDSNYKEPKIDYLRNQKDEQLEKLIKETEMELKIKNGGD